MLVNCTKNFIAISLIKESVTLRCEYRERYYCNVKVHKKNNKEEQRTMIKIKYKHKILK